MRVRSPGAPAQGLAALGLRCTLLQAATDPPMKQPARRHLALLALATALLPAAAHASEVWPSKPVRLVVPYAPGGTSDAAARLLAERLQAALGQPIIVEYKPGAATNIGTDFVAKSAPDGHTLLINGITLATNPFLFPNLPFNPLTDLAPIIEVAEIANVITAHPNTGLTTLKQVVDAAKAQPARFNYGTPGAGSSGHLSAELLGLKTGAKFTHVPYQGNAQATTDHLSGTLEIGFVNLPVAMPFITSGRLKPLAVTSRKRSAALPDVPTVAEALGIPDYELSGWFGIMAPARTPPEVIARLEALINEKTVAGNRYNEQANREVDTEVF